MSIQFAPIEGRAGDRMRDGLIRSSALHLVALALLIGLPWLDQPPPQLVVVPIDMVVLGPRTGAPPAPATAALPQQPAPEDAEAEQPQAVPEPGSPAAEAHHPADQQRAPEAVAAPIPATRPDHPKPEAAPVPNGAASAPKPSPTDSLSLQLKRLARLRQPSPPVPPSPRTQDGAGISNTAATSPNAGTARDATYSLKDFIRVQVERRWNFDLTTPGSQGWSVAIRIALTQTGEVQSAEIVETPQYRTDRAYRDFALSARNAVLLSTPLAIPPGTYAIARDITVDFSARQAVQ